MTRLISVVRGNVVVAVVALGAATVLVLGLSLLAGLDPGIAIPFGLVVLAAGAAVHRVWRGPFSAEATIPMGHAVVSGLVGFVAVMLLIQAVPYGRDHSNPPVIAEPSWDSPATRDLAVAACFDCHSNEVVYPWYSNVAPFSWAVARHVSVGRRVLNFSEWGTRHQEADEAAETVLEGTMPPFYFTLAHPEARLSAADKRALADGLNASLRR